MQFCAVRSSEVLEVGLRSGAAALGGGKPAQANGGTEAPAGVPSGSFSDSPPPALSVLPSARCSSPRSPRSVVPLGCSWFSCLLPLVTLCSLLALPLLPATSPVHAACALATCALLLTFWTPSLRRAARAWAHPRAVRRAAEGVDAVVCAQARTGRAGLWLAEVVGLTVSVPFYGSALPAILFAGYGDLCVRTVGLMAFCLYVGNALKDLCCSPRPAAAPGARGRVRVVGADADEARRNALEYGFPSSHVMNTVGMYFYILLYATERSTWVAERALPLTLAATLWTLFVAYTRMQLGVHTPLDLWGGALAGALVTSGFWFFAPHVGRAGRTATARGAHLGWKAIERIRAGDAPGDVARALLTALLPATVAGRLHLLAMTCPGQAPDGAAPTAGGEGGPGALASLAAAAGSPQVLACAASSSLAPLLSSVPASSPWSASVLPGCVAALLSAALFLRFHPTPARHTPSLEFSASFAGVAFGVSSSALLRWGAAGPPLRDLPPASLWALARRIVVGLAFAVACKEATRAVLRLVVPRLFALAPNRLRQLWQPPLLDVWGAGDGALLDDEGGYDDLGIWGGRARTKPAPTRENNAKQPQTPPQITPVQAKMAGNAPNATDKVASRAETSTGTRTDAATGPDATSPIERRAAIAPNTPSGPAALGPATPSPIVPAAVGGPPNAPMPAPAPRPPVARPLARDDRGRPWDEEIFIRFFAYSAIGFSCVLVFPHLGQKLGGYY